MATGLATAWHKALYLSERSERFSMTPGGSSPASARAHKRLDRWKGEFPLSADEFAARLKQDSLDEDSFLSLLDTAPAQLVDEDGPGSARPEWLDQLIAAYEADGTTQLDLPESARSHAMAGFLSIVAPLLARSRRRAREAIDRMIAARKHRDREAVDVPFEPQRLVEQLYVPLPAIMLRYLARTMILELHVARLSGALQSDTSERRYREFVEQLADRERALALLEEYPVLARSLAECAERWVAVMSEFAGRLIRDWNELVATFFAGTSPGAITDIDAGAGDSHRGGRSVMILAFESGARLVYKPRSLAADVAFQDLVAWLNQRGDHPELKLLRVLDRGEYGWVEFIEHRQCQSPGEAARFFARQGAYLALFHAIEATDFHFENVIAQGEHPVPIDLETLFQPRVHLDGRESELMAAQKMAFSVLRVGLLPNLKFTEEEAEEVDISGLSPVKDQLTPKKQHYFESAGTDEIRLVRRRLPMEEGRNLPMLDGQHLDVLEHQEHLVRGFESMYRLLERHRNEMWASGGPLAAFADVPIRVVLRPTQLYATLLRESFHPDVLRDALDRDRLFDRLWETLEVQPNMRPAIPAELGDLRRGDIPMFTGRPSSRDLIDGAGNTIKDMLERPGIEQSQDRMAGFGDDDLAQQVWFIQASLATLAMSQENSDMAAYRFRPGARAATRDELIDAARLAGDRLCETAIAGKDDVTWIGLAVNHFKWLLTPLKNEMYTGLPGVVLFLAYLGRQTGESKYTDLAEKAYETLASQIAQGKDNIFSPGSFGGWAGIIYLQTHLAAVWDRPALLDEAEELAEKIPPLIAEDTSYDVLYGAAGAIAGLLVLYRARPSKRLLELAIACGQHLLEHAKPVGRGLGWTITAAGDHALAGYSHGAAGVAWALSHLAQESGQERFRAAAHAAMVFERSVFSAERKNWPDLRDPDPRFPRPHEDEQHFMCAWCHGASGIGMARLDMAGFDGDPELASDIDAALETTRSSGFGGNHSLCHGDLGNLELLLLAARQRDDSALHDEVYRCARGILDSIDRHGWISGVPLGVETPGLMNGLSGIGYNLLRLADPDAVPSVLLLHGPAAIRKAS